MPESQAALVCSELRRLGEQIGVGESLTGGLVTAELTAIAGASDSVRGGVVAYATDVKSSVLGVSAELLAERGPVDPEVARSMAQAAGMTLAARFGVATTGVAGPDQQDGKAVGTVYIAIHDRATATSCCRHLQLTGSRVQIRHAAVGALLEMTLEFLRSI